MTDNEILALIGVLQLVVFGLQAYWLRETIEATKRNAARQLRAYVSVVTGQYGPQDLNRPANMEVRPVIKNTGQTPAYAVSTAFVARVLPYPLPDGFDFSLPVAEREEAGVVGAGESHFVIAVLDRTLSAAELQEIAGAGRNKLYVYGRVTYRDAFGQSHYTNFCQFSLWDQAGNHFGINTHRHNDAD